MELFPYNGSCRILSINSIMEVSPKNHTKDGFVGSNSIMVVCSVGTSLKKPWALIEVL